MIAYGVSSNTLFKGYATAFVIGAIAWLVALLALRQASHAVSRERLLGLGSG